MTEPPLTPLEHQQLRVATAPAETFWHRVRFGLVIRHALRCGAGEVLDIGAGSGLLGNHAVAAGLRYRFTEESPALRSGLVDRFGQAALAGDRDPIGPDVVVALLDVIEHVADDRGLLADVAARMAPGARMVVTVPAMPRLYSSWDRDLGHHRRYGRRDAATAVAAAGLEVVEAAYLFPELVPLAAVRRLRRSDGATTEFPALPEWLDRSAGAVGALTTAARRAWPFGTSVVVVARRGAA